MKTSTKVLVISEVLIFGAVPTIFLTSKPINWILWGIMVPSGLALWIYQKYHLQKKEDEIQDTSKAEAKTK